MRTDYTSSQQVVWAPKVPPGPQLILERYSQFDLHPGTHFQLGMVLGGYSQQINAGEKEDG